MKRRQLNIVQLYPEQMNLYGDYGNAQIICRRAELYGYQAKLISYNSAPDMANLVKADLILGGGGQDSGQRAILGDLVKLKSELPGMIEAGVPMLVICGLYQLMGHYFQTGDGDRLTGLGIFDAVTVAGQKRLVGNAVVDAGDELGVLVGYENHSGRTDLGKEQAPLGLVIKGWGNDGAGKLEGAIKLRVLAWLIGCWPGRVVGAMVRRSLSRLIVMPRRSWLIWNGCQSEPARSP